MQVTTDRESAMTLGVVLVLFGALFIWVRYAHDDNVIAKAIYRTYERAALVRLPLDPFFLAGGIGLIVLGGLFVLGLIG